MLKPRKLLCAIYLSIVFIFIFSGPVSAAAELKDGFTTGDNSEITTWSPNQIIGQTWTASSSYQLSYLEIYVRRVGNPGDVIFNISSTSDENPLSTSLASIPLAADSIPAINSWVRFDLSPDTVINISAGSTYWWGVYAASGDQNRNYYAIRLNRGTAYSNGFAYTSSNGGITWNTEMSFDYLFGIYSEASAAEITPPPVVSTPTLTPPPVTSAPVITPPPVTSAPIITPAQSLPASSSNVPCPSSVLPAIIAGVASGLTGAAIAGTLAYGRGKAIGMKNLLEPSRPSRGVDEEAGKRTGPKDENKPDDESKKPREDLILNVSCRVQNHVSGGETHTERRQIYKKSI